MTAVLAVESMYDAIAARFAAEAGKVTSLEPHTAASVSTSGTPTQAASPRVLFPTGGTVGVSGITYQASPDDGTTYGPVTPLGTASTIIFLGVTLTLAGVIANADFVRWTQTDPAVPVFAFGTREPAKRGHDFRVTFVPGDEGGNAGEVGPVREPGRQPGQRWVARLDELVTVYCEAFDASAPEDERAQWRAARLLWDAFQRAAWKAAHGTFEVLRTEHLVERSTRRHGWAIRSVLSVWAPVPDSPWAVPVGVVADETITMLSQTDEQTVTP